MDLASTLMGEGLDEIIRRSALRLQQQHAHVDQLAIGSRQRVSAAAALAESVSAHSKLKAYRAKFA